MLKIRHPLCFYILILGSVQGADFTYPFHIYSSNEGLIQSVAYSIYQDTDGYIWIGTKAGASRFNGKDFENFDQHNGLGHSSVRQIYQQKNGQLWFATQFGISLYIDKGKFKNFGADSGFPDFPIRCMIEDHNGVLWIGTWGGGLIQFKDGKIKQFNKPDQFSNLLIRALCLDPEGNLIIGTYGGGIVRKTGDLFTQIPIENPQIRALFCDREGLVWVGTNNGLFYITGNGTKEFQLNTDRDLGRINVFSEDENGALWVGTSRAGAFTKVGNDLVFFDSSKGMPAGAVISMVKDDENRMWFGTYGGGIARLNGRNFQNYLEQPDFKSPNTMAIRETEDGALWLGLNHSGVVHFEDGVFHQYDKKDGLVHNKVLCVEILKDGSVWLGTLGGISIFKNGSFKNMYTSTDGFAHNTVYSILECTNGDVWLGTLNGISRYDGESFTTLSERDGPPVTRVNVLEETRNGVILVGTPKGLFSYSDGKLKGHLFGGLTDKYFILDIFEDSNRNLWLCTNSGLVKASENEFRIFTRQDGLSSSMCTAIIEGDDGSLWIGTNRGVNRFIDHTFSSFGYKDGLAANEINNQAVLKGKDGNIWFGTTAGVSVFDTKIHRQPLSPPHLNLNELQVNGQPKSFEDRLYTYDENSFRFFMSAAALTDRAGVRFFYRLKGMGDAWTETDSYAVNYPFIPPGEYTFEIYAANSMGLRSETLQYGFIIKPAMWQELWFSLTIGFLLLLLVTLIIFRMKRMNVILEKKVKERTLEITRMNMELKQLALSDELTKTKNRHYLELIMPSEMDDLRRMYFDSFDRPDAKYTTMGLAMIDIDYFKEVNDTYGHATGDEVLQLFAQRLKQTVRQSDRVVRWGGEEFVVFYRKIEPSAIGEITEKIRKQIAHEPFRLKNKTTIPIYCSIGYCLFPPSFDGRQHQWKTILSLADWALYKAKQKGRNRSTGVKLSSPEAFARAMVSLNNENSQGTLEADIELIHHDPFA